MTGMPLTHGGLDGAGERGQSARASKRAQGPVRFDRGPCSARCSSRNATGRQEGSAAREAHFGSGRRCCRRSIFFDRCRLLRDHQANRSSNWQTAALRTLVAWLSRLGPYPTLALFLVPLVVLEPVKPVGLYLIATSHMTSGVLLIAVGEVLKITIVERLFHFSRNKLMSIRTFAWAYNWVMAGVNYFQAQPLWQAVSRQFGVIRQTVKEAVHRWFRRLKRLSHPPT